MKINLNNKKIKLAIIIIIIISAFISIMAIYKYYINDWICYQENVSPQYEMTGIDVLDYRIYLKRSGFVYIPRKDNRILSKSEMNELKKLLKELKNSDISGKYDYYEDGLFIDGKKYNKNQENEYIYDSIVTILKNSVD
ncbi:MAG: hypothetical protein HXK67_05760 [Clostridiales bacterium]|jgi:hypothetical protein|nr:hypothetical protein [Clostridiales bacterium]